MAYPRPLRACCAGVRQLGRASGIVDGFTTPMLSRGRPSRITYSPHPGLGNRRGLMYLPAVLHPSFWKSLVPTFLRRDHSGKHVKRKGWNPATYFIWMSLLIGSQAIQMITLRTGFDKFTQETDQKLALLRDVVKRIQNGEDVDVEKLLGSGDAVKEKEWEAVMRELEAEDAVFRNRRKQRKATAAAEDESQTPDESTAT